MSHIKGYLFFFFICIFLSQILMAQEGGPPMLTDDARVADYKEWELNTSINTSITNHLELSTPHIDLNYGVYHNLQLKIEAPLILDFVPNKKVGVHVGEIIAGVKYRFLNEEKHFISTATFPQYTFNVTPGFFLPLFVERTFGRFLTGIGVGYFFGLKHKNRSEIGGIVGFRATEKTHLMVEYYSIQRYHDIKGMNGYVNLGFRQEIHDYLVIMTSFGTQPVVPTGGTQERFISWIGVRTLF